MAGEWIKMRTNLWDDPRVCSICDATGLLEAQVIGGLYWLWKSADEHTETGFMPGLSARSIDRKTGCAGLGQALVAVGWITESDGGITLNNFEEHNGASAKKRCQTAKRVANFKSANAEVTHEALLDHECGVSDEFPEQQGSVIDALPREEKRREEEIRETKEGSAARKRSAPPPARPDDVTEQVWADWMALRKAKRAPVSETVLSGARSEASKAFLSLDRFLAIWCTRGSQGLQADWLRPEECGRPVASQQRPVAAEPAWRTEQRLRMQQAAPGVAARPMTQPQQPDFIDVEAHDAHAARLA